MDQESFFSTIEDHAKWVSVVHDAFHAQPHAIRDDRNRLSRALLAGSVDHAVSIHRLLKCIDDPSYISAFALFRVQLDYLLRAIFFGSAGVSSDAEVEDFLQNDRLPKREAIGASGSAKPGNLSFEHLVRAARDVVGELAPASEREALGAMFDYAIKEAHGLIHGGREVANLYVEIDGKLEFARDEARLCNLSKHSAVLCQVALGFLIARVSGVKPVGYSTNFANAEDAANFLFVSSAAMTAQVRIEVFRTPPPDGTTSSSE